MSKISGEPKPKGKRKVEHISIRREANGFTVGHRLEQRKPNAHGMPMPYEESPKDAVFTDKGAAHEHVGNLMGQMGGDEAGAPSPAGEEVEA